MAGMAKTLKYVEIETVNSCTRSCEWCPFGSCDEYSARTPAYLETIYIQAVLEELRAIEFCGMLTLCSINEPLMDHRITSGELPALCKRILGNAKLLLITNGDLLTADNMDRMFAAGLDKLIVSCYDDETHGRVVAHQRAVPHYIERQDKRYFLNGDWEYNRAGAVACKDHTTYRQCFLPVFQSVIGWDGEVRLCCYDALGTVKLGNIREKGLMEILTGKRADDLRKQIKTDRSTVSPCSRCNVAGSIASLFDNNSRW